MRALLVALVVLAAAPAAAEGPAATADGLARAPTVIGVPTAWIQEGGALHVTGDVDHHGSSGVRVTKSLGRLAELDLGADDAVVACDPCTGPMRATEGVQLASAGFKLALWEHRFRPALAVGVRAPIGPADRARAAEAYAVASKTLGPIRLHVGASAWATEHRLADDTLVRVGGLRTVRPLVGLEWKPVIYPRTTLSADAQFVPELGPTRADTAPRWRFAWAVRYRALSWAAIELAVKHRQGEALGDAAVMLRLSARLGRGTHL